MNARIRSSSQKSASLVIAAVSFVELLVPNHSAAVVLTWKGTPTDTLWSHSNNWSPNAVPSPAADTVFSATGASTVTFDGPGNALTLTQTKGDVQFEMNHQTLTLAGTGNAAVFGDATGPNFTVSNGTISVPASGAAVVIGTGVAARLNLTGDAHLSVPSGYINAGDAGSMPVGAGPRILDLNGPSVTATAAVCYAGANAQGRIIVEQGATLTAGNLSIAAAASGEVDVSSSNVYASNLYVGGFNNQQSNQAGLLDVTGSSVVRVNGLTRVWNSNSFIRLHSGSLTTGSLDAGSNASGLDWTGGTLAINGSPLTIDSTGNTQLGSSRSLSAGQTLRMSGAKSDPDRRVGYGFTLCHRRYRGLVYRRQCRPNCPCAQCRQHGQPAHCGRGEQFSSHGVRSGGRLARRRHPERKRWRHRGQRRRAYRLVRRLERCRKCGHERNCSRANQRGTDLKYRRW